MDKPTVGDFISELHKFADVMSKLQVNDKPLDSTTEEAYFGIKAMRLLVQGAISEVEKEKNEREVDRETPKTAKGF